MNKLMVGIVAFLLVGAYMITVNKEYDIKNDADDREGFLKDFSGWIVNLGKNVKDVAGVAKEKEWLPNEEDYEEYSDNDTIKK
ncbi:MAG: hypothetical protein KJ674_04340 [Nanoarchaeota archaeon]|nr:hypothetical protein [Nanoarchaeota archaeon]